MGKTREQQAKDRANKALKSGNTAFRARGPANKAMFQKMKDEFADVKKHTTKGVLGVAGQNMEPFPGQTQMAALLVGPSTTVGVLNSILCAEGIECKGTKSDKADLLVQKKLFLFVSSVCRLNCIG